MSIYFSLKINQAEYPCKFYHMEPTAFKQTGLRMSLMFELDELGLSEELTQAQLVFKDPVFNQQQIELPLQIQQ